MTDPSLGQAADRIWLCMADSNRTRVLSRALAKGMGMTVYMGPTMDDEGPVALVLADDRHKARIADARANAAENQKSILVTAGAQRSGADIVLNHDIDAGTLANAVEGVRALRRYEMAIPASQDVGNGALKTLSDAEFSLRTLAEASDIAMFLGRSCPQPAAITVGLYVLLANSIEHGNLQFDATEKAKGLAEGNWSRKLAKRMDEPDFIQRRVKLRFRRGGRLISFIIQDDGEGIDAETAEMANPAGAGYRGKGIKMARALGFSQVSWLGIGNTVEASVVLPDANAAAEQAPAMARRA
ncbi:hypothetical protein [Maricaulis sp. CAU 1757]